MKTKNRVKINDIAEFIQACVDNLNTMSKSADAITVAYYEMLKRALRDLAHELGLFKRSRSKYTTTQAVQRAVNTILAENRAKHDHPDAHDVTKFAHKRIDETFRSAFLRWMPAEPIIPTRFIRATKPSFPNVR